MPQTLLTKMCGVLDDLLIKVHDPKLLRHRGHVQGVPRTAEGNILLKIQKPEGPITTVVLVAFLSALATKVTVRSVR